MKGVYSRLLRYIFGGTEQPNTSPNVAIPNFQLLDSRQPCSQSRRPFFYPPHLCQFARSLNRFISATVSSIWCVSKGISPPPSNLPACKSTSFLSFVTVLPVSCGGQSDGTVALRGVTRRYAAYDGLCDAWPDVTSLGVTVVRYACVTLRHTRAEDDGQYRGGRGGGTVNGTQLWRMFFFNE